MSFLGDYTRYSRTRTDCPPEFHLHAGLATLSVALGNRVYSDGWSDDIFPTLWVLLIAPSGWGKSVPLHMSQRILQLAGLGERVLPGSFSQEALHEQIHDKRVGIFYPQEFAAFLGVLGRDYNRGCMEWLTDVYDVPMEDRKTLRNKEVVLERPFVSILAASSPIWFAQAYKDSMLGGGFFARFIFCPAKKPGDPIPTPGPRDEQLEDKLAGHVRRVSQLRGKADFSEVWQQYSEFDRSSREDRTDDEFGGMRSRASALVRKVSILFHVSRDPSNLRIGESDLKHAISYVTESQRRTIEYLSNEVAHNREDADCLAILNAARRRGGKVEWSAALKTTHLGSFRFRNAIKTLVESRRAHLAKAEGSKADWIVTDDAPEERSHLSLRTLANVANGHVQAPEGIPA